jgi:hypothetical protein
VTIIITQITVRISTTYNKAEEDFELSSVGEKVFVPKLSLILAVVPVVDRLLHPKNSFTV